MNKLDNTIFWKTYFLLAKSASHTDFQVWNLNIFLNAKNTQTGSKAPFVIKSSANLLLINIFYVSEVQTID